MTLRAAFAVVVVASLAGCYGGYDGPDTRTLKANFAKHREAFEELANMLREDRNCKEYGDRTIDVFKVGIGCVCGHNVRDVVRSAPTDSNSLRADSDSLSMQAVVGISQARYRRYYELLERIGAREVSYFKDRHESVDPWDFRPEISIPAGNAGMWSHGYYVATIWSERTPPQVVDDVFDFLKAKGGDGGRWSVYSPLDAGWYVEMVME